MPIIGDILGLLSVAVDKIFPDKDEALKLGIDKQKIKNELELEVMKRSMEEKKLLFQDMDSARELYKAELQKTQSKVAAFIRDVFRPVVGFAVFGMWIYNIIAPMGSGIPRLELTQFDYSIILAVVGFYFGGRTIEKIKGKAK